MKRFKYLIPCLIVLACLQTLFAANTEPPVGTLARGNLSDYSEGDGVRGSVYFIECNPLNLRLLCDAPPSYLKLQIRPDCFLSMGVEKNECIQCSLILLQGAERLRQIDFGTVDQYVRSIGKRVDAEGNYMVQVLNRDQEYRFDYGFTEVRPHPSIGEPFRIPKKPKLSPLRTAYLCVEYRLVPVVGRVVENQAETEQSLEEIAGRLYVFNFREFTFVFKVESDLEHFESVFEGADRWVRSLENASS